MICPNCGQEGTGKFCTACGARLPEAPLQPNMNPGELPENNAAPSYDAAPQGYNAAPGYDAGQFANADQGFQGYSAPVQSQPNQGYAAPNQGYAPNQPGYYANQPNQGYAPNPAYPNYVPGQGFNPGQQVMGSYQGVPAGAIGQTPASQLVRRLASGPVFLIAILAATLSFCSAGFVNFKQLLYYIDWFDYYNHSAYAAELFSGIATNAVTLFVDLLVLILLWNTYASALNRSRDRISTALLTWYKVLAVISMIFLILGFLFLLVLFAMFLFSSSYSDFMKDAVEGIYSTLAQQGLTFPDFGITEVKVFVLVFLGVVLFFLALVILYLAAIIRTINSGKQVINTGIPNRRASVFVGVLSILHSLALLSSGISQLAQGGGFLNVLYGIGVILSAVSTFCFAVLVFQFRSAMKQAGAV